jgi:hypothetical protein
MKSFLQKYSLVAAITLALPFALVGCNKAADDTSSTTPPATDTNAAAATTPAPADTNAPAATTDTNAPAMSTDTNASTNAPAK